MKAFKISFAWVYNLTNLTGVCLIGFGFGLIQVEYGLIAAGTIVLLLNIHTSKVARSQ